MGTRAIIALTEIDKEQEKNPGILPETLYFYRHWDGDPEEVQDSLGTFCRWLKEGKIRNNLYQASGWLVLAGRKEELEVKLAMHGRGKHYTAVPAPLSPEVKIESSVAGNNGNGASWKVGSYDIVGPSVRSYINIEYIHVVDVATGSWHPVPWEPCADESKLESILEKQIGKLPLPDPCADEDNESIKAMNMDTVISTVACALASGELKPWVEWEFALADSNGKTKGQYRSRPYFLSKDMRTLGGQLSAEPLPDSRLMVRRTIRGKSPQYNCGAMKEGVGLFEREEIWNDSEEAAIEALELPGAPDSGKEDTVYDSPAP